MDNVKVLGTWWDDTDIEVIEHNGCAIALNGWTGDRFADCFYVSDKTEHGMFLENDGDCEFDLIPIMEPEKVDEDGEVLQWKIVRYDELMK